MKKILIAVLCAVLTVSFCSCSTGKNEKVVNLYTWEGYVPENIIEDFTTKTGIKVNYTNFSSNEEMYAKLKAVNAGDFDVVIASDYMFQIMNNEGGLMSELDYSKVPNYKYVSPSYLGKEFDKDNKYVIPYVSGCVLMAYNSKTSPFVPMGYSDLLDPRLEGQVVVLDDMRVVTGMMNLMLGNSLNETDESKLNDAKNALIKMRPNIVAFNSDKPHEIMLSGEANVGLMYNSQVAAAIAENPDIKVVYPKEGIGIGVDGFFIPKNAPHSDEAYEFINYILDPKVNADIMPQIEYTPTNAKALDYLPENFKNNKAVNVPQELTKNSESVLDIGDKAQLYSDIWTEFKSQK